MKKRTKVLILIFTIIALLVVVIYLIIFFWRSIQKPTDEFQVSQEPFEIQSLFEEKGCEEVLKLVEKRPSLETLGTEETLLIILECYFKNKYLQEALRISQKLIDRYPTSDKVPFALYFSAQSYFKIGDLEKAKEYCEKILKEYPNAPQEIIDGAKNLLRFIEQT